MKIFFISPKFCGLFKRKNILTYSALALFFVLLTCQLVTHIKTASEPAMSQNAIQSRFSLTLETSGTVPKEGAMIVVNGEEYSPLNSPSSVVELERASVVEVFCKTDANFSVSVRPSVGLTVIMQDEKANCQKGMNYVCRCFFDS